jgi:hypothetical protein
VSGDLVRGAARSISIVFSFLSCLFIFFFRPRSRALRFGIWWVFFSVLSAALLSGAALHPRYFYFPLAATSFLLAWLLIACAERLGGPRRLLRGALTAALSSSLLIPLAVSIQDRQAARTAMGAFVQREVDFVLHRLKSGCSHGAIVYALNFPADIRGSLASSGQLGRRVLGRRHQGRWQQLFFVYFQHGKWSPAAIAYALTMPGVPSAESLPLRREGFYFLGKELLDHNPPDSIDTIFPASLPRAIFVFREGRVVDMTREYLPVTGVTFRLRAPAAGSVRLTGDFTDWKEIPLTPRADGSWETTLKLFPNTYRYQFLVDDAAPIPDPENPSRRPVPGRGECSLRAVINPALPAGLLPTGDRTRDRMIIRCKERVALYPRSASLHRSLAALYRHYGFPREAELEEEMVRRLRQSFLPRLRAEKKRGVQK